MRIFCSFEEFFDFHDCSINTFFRVYKFDNFLNGGIFSAFWA